MINRLKVFWWRAPRSTFGNFGDEITAPLLGKLFGIEVARTRMREAELIGSGSILDAWSRRRGRPWLRNVIPFPASLDLHVWGSGLIKPNSRIDWPQRIHLHAVRGQLTADRTGGSPILGDPGILASLLLEKEPLKAAAVGIVPHHDDFASISQIELPSEWRLINPIGPVESVITKIAECELILSSSLHGLITADSLTIPCVWLSTNRRLYGDTFKFFDYASARQAPLNEPLSYRAVMQIRTEDIAEMGSVAGRSISQWQHQLVEAFPTELRRN